MRQNLTFIGVAVALVVVFTVLSYFRFKSELKYGSVENGYKIYRYEKETQVYMVDPESRLTRTIRDTNKDGIPDIVLIGAGKAGESSTSVTTQDSIDWAKAFQK